MVSGSFWMIGINLVRRGLGFVSMIVLARLLPPESFGLVAMASVLIATLHVLTEFGFDIALIQKQAKDRSRYDTAWTFNVIFGLLSALLLVASALPASTFYDEPRLAPIVVVLAAGVAIGGFENIGIVDFRKELQFQREFLFHSIIRITSFIVALTVAVVTGSHWALVCGMLVTRVLSVFLSYAMHDFRPRFSIAARADLFSFSVWMFLNNLLFFIRTRSAHYIIGRMLGARSLGVFTVGQEISYLSSEIITPINQAILPGYARISSNIARLRSAFLNVVAMIAMIALPCAIGISAVAALAVPVLLGSEWLDVVPVVEVLALVAVLTAFQSNISDTFIAMGRPRLLIFVQAGGAVLLLTLAIILVRLMGIMGMVYAYLAANSLVLLVSWTMMSRLVNIRTVDAGAVVVRPMLAAGVMYGIVSWLGEFVTPFVPMWLALIASVTVGAGVFVASVWFSWSLAGRPEGAETFILGQCKSLPLVGSVAGRILRTEASG